MRHRFTSLLLLARINQIRATSIFRHLLIVFCCLRSYVSTLVYIKVATLFFNEFRNELKKITKRFVCSLYYPEIGYLILDIRYETLDPKMEEDIYYLLK